jgi:hypothetical protein
VEESQVTTKYHPVQLRERPRLTGQYLTGRTLFALATQMCGYYWERQNGATYDDQNKTYTVHLGNGAYIGGADSPADARALVLTHFKAYLLELARGV